MVLEIRSLRFGYTQDRLLFDDFNLSLESGKLVSIVGESGRGKSTLFDLITGELKPLAGSIKKEKTAQIYQDPYSSFHHTYSIRSQIKDVASLEGIDELLPKLGLSNDLLDKKPFELSGGQLQRCSILRAVLMRPKLILADEPTSALDNITALEVMKLLLNFLDRAGILLITHDLDLAKWCSDEIVYI